MTRMRYDLDHSRDLSKPDFVLDHALPPAQHCIAAYHSGIREVAGHRHHGRVHRMHHNHQLRHQLTSDAGMRALAMPIGLAGLSVTVPEGDEVGLCLACVKWLAVWSCMERANRAKAGSRLRRDLRSRLDQLNSAAKRQDERARDSYGVTHSAP